MAQAAFRGLSPSSSPGPPPAAPPRRTDSQTSPSHTPNLVPKRNFGDVDTSSVSKAFSSIRASSNPPPPAAPPIVSPAFSAKKNTFGPPPVRRVSSSGGGDHGEETSAAPPPAVRRAAALPPRREPTPEPEGEWAEALYDYDSQDPSDVKLQEGQRVLVTDRASSDDWWTGEADGKKGLFPASYVRLL